jgi:hypothetical protein
MENNLFHYLTSRGIFKNWMESNRTAEKTERRSRERHRGILVWLALGRRKDPDTGKTIQSGKGTYIRAKHGRLRFDKN